LVESVDLKAKTLKIEGGGEEKWDKLIVATGRKPRSLPIEGKELEGIHLLRTIEHAKAIDAGACPAG
jgi:3-phenylpropionate/trans-cinnamate dioxygenase ferredoxin reductase subunit